jgi:hypothetical protein
MDFHRFWIGNCMSLPSGTLNDLGNIKILHPSNFSLCLCERWGLRIVNACKHEELEGSNMNSDHKNWAFLTATYLARSLITSWCVQDDMWNKYRTLTGYGAGGGGTSWFSLYSCLRGCVGLTTLLPSCADCLELWEPQPPVTLRAYPGL